MKKRTHDRIFTFSPRHVWRGGLLLLALALITALIAYAGASNPGFLNENTSDISAGNHTYRVWYTTSCDDGSSSDCECDPVDDKDTDGDGVDDTDSPNDCIATSDSDGDGIFDTGADSDGDGVLNLMDLGWTNSGAGVVESTPRNVQRSVNRYVNDWNLKDPKWDRDENRNIYVYDIGSLGRAFGDGSGELYDAVGQMRRNMDSRATVLHELWHNEQYAYSAGGGAWLMEGQAAFLEDKVFQDLDRYQPSWHHGLVDGYLGNPVNVKREDRDDDGTKEFAQTIGLTGRSHQAALWWTYIAEQAGTQYIGTTWEGIDALEAVLEQSDDHGRKGKDAVDRVLRDRLGQGFDDTFWDFTLANYAKEFDLTELDHGYLHGRDPEEVLQYRDEVLTGTSPVNYDPVGRTTIGGTDLSGGKSSGVNAKSSEISSTTTMPAYGARYYEADLTSVSECPLVYWQVEAGYGQWRGDRRQRAEWRPEPAPHRRRSPPAVGRVLGGGLHRAHLHRHGDLQNRDPALHAAARVSERTALPRVRERGGLREGRRLRSIRRHDRRSGPGQRSGVLLLSPASGRLRRHGAAVAGAARRSGHRSRAAEGRGDHKRRRPVCPQPDRLGHRSRLGRHQVYAGQQQLTGPGRRAAASLSG